MNAGFVKLLKCAFHLFFRNTQNLIFLFFSKTFVGKYAFQMKGIHELLLRVSNDFPAFLYFTKRLFNFTYGTGIK